MPILIGILIVVIVIVALIWFFVGFMADAWNLFGNWFYHDILLSWFFPNGANIFMATPFFWIVLSAIVLIVLFFVFGDSYSGDAPGWLGMLAIVVVIALLVVTVRGFWVLEENGARAYLSTTEFIVEDEDNVPSMLSMLETSPEAMVDIEEGSLPTDWVARVASATGAEKVLKRTGDAINNTELMGDTMTYIYNEDGDGGVWTAIRNGKNQQPIYGVASWDGSGEDVSTCEFEGDYELNKAFGGMWGKNLSNTIAAKFPLFTYNSSDMWGYCDNGEPIIVIPGTTTVGYDVRTIDQNNGILTVQGSPSGEPVITHVTDVKPGDYPGPVYAQRLVNQQLGSLAWAAGRHLNWFQNFGFEPTDVSSQSGNNSNYLLKDPEDGRLYWVTPLKPRSTDSQTLIAYSVTPADITSAGELNEQKVYVLSDDDPRVVNLDNLEATVIDAVRTSDPGFFTGDTPGRIVEFLPVSDDAWQVFAEVNGRVKYRIDVSIGATIKTTVVLVDGGSESPVPTDTADPSDPSGEVVITCDDPAVLTDTQIANCIAELASELQQRGVEATP